MDPVLKFFFFFFLVGAGMLDLNPSRAGFREPTSYISLQIQDHGAGILQVGLPQVGEPGHGRSVDDAMIGGPAHLHDGRPDHVPLAAEAGQDLDSSDGSYSHLWGHNDGLGVRSTNL